MDRGLDGVHVAAACGPLLLLVEELAASEDAARQAVLLQAVSNAGLPAHVNVIERFVDASSADVRESAAIALGGLPGAPSGELLQRLAGDPSAEVQGTALGSMARRGLSERDLRAIDGLVDQGRIVEANVGALASYLTATPRSASVGQILRKLASSSLDSPELAARVRALAADYPL